MHLLKPLKYILPHYRKKVISKLLYSQKKKEQLELAEAYKENLNDLNEKGFTFFNKNFAKECDQILAEYDKYESVEVNESRRKAAGFSEWKYFSFAEDNVAKIFLDEDLVKLIYNYYGFQPKYRRMPYIKFSPNKETKDGDIAELMHRDGTFKQITMFLYLEDVDQEMPFTELLEGSNKERFPVDDRHEFNSKKYDKYKLAQAFGKKGDLVIADTGSTYHKVTYPKTDSKKVRKIIQASMSTGDHRPKATDMDIGTDRLKSMNLPKLVENSIDEILL